MAKTIYVNEYENGICSVYHTKEDAEKYAHKKSVVRVAVQYRETTEESE